MENQGSESKVNGLLIIYVFGYIFGLFWDYLKLGEYLVLSNISANISKLSGTTIILIFLLFLIIIGWIGNKRNDITRLRSRVYFTKIDAGDWLILAIIALLTFWRLPFPDASFDTMHYHLFLQQSQFENYISDNFLPSGIQTYSFSLGDRLFYFFRNIIGYRSGVLLNSLVLFLVYLQLKEILFSHFHPYKIQPKYLQALIGLSIVSTEFILANIGIYMVDLLPLPFLIELFKITIKNSNKDAFGLVYSFTLMGLAISIKFYSIIFCFPMALIIFVRNIRLLNLKLIVYMLLAVVLPMLPYLIFNYVQTRNPIFPYFNQLFKSPYYPPVYTKDPRFGPTNFLETISWPIIILFIPGRSIELPYYSGRIGLGYLFLIFYLIHGIRSKNKEILHIALLILLFFFLWIISTGYARYALFLEVISGIVILLISLALLFSKKVMMKFLGTSLLMVFLAQISYGYYLTLTNKTDWSDRATIITNPRLYYDNLRLLGSDRLPRNLSNIQQADRILQSVDLWLVLPGDHNAGIVKLLKSDIPIVNLYLLHYSQTNRDNYLKIITDAQLKKKNIFMLSCRSDDQISQELEPVGLQMSDSLEIKSTILDFRGKCRLIRITSE